MKYTTYIKLLISIGILSAGAWYFGLKDYNYKITFTSTQAPGIIYANLLQWNNGEAANTKAVTTLSKSPFSEILQEATIADSVFRYRWVIKRRNDSVTKITAFIKDTKNSFLQDLQVPFYKTDFVKRSITSVKKVRDGLKKHEGYYKVSDVQESTLPSTYCAYIPLSSSLKDKGNTMIKNISVIMDYIKGNDIALNGNPFLEITEWNIPEDRIHFNFCFPVKMQDSFPDTEAIKFKKTAEQKALKTTFNGNYRISDRGWYTIIDYAENNNITIENLPIEVYLNDPHSGGDELQWEAEIYMPVKNE